ncbi:hypothetical protein Bca4012_072780 [Brassica carinata]
MENRKNQRVKKPKTPKKKQKAEEQFLEDVTHKEVSDLGVEEQKDKPEEEQNNMVEEEQNDMVEEEQNNMEKEEQNDMEEEEQTRMEEEEQNPMDEEEQTPMEDGEHVEMEEGEQTHMEEGAAAQTQADGVQTQTDRPTEPERKSCRGATKMKHIARDPTEREHVDFTDLGEPCGPGSVLLSSYLGPLVCEHVPVTIDNWRKMRFDLDEDFKKAAVLKQMGCLWRASKSRLVTAVRQAPTIKARMSLRPNNVTTTEWHKFVREKTSTAFKDGTPVNVNAAEKIRKATEIELEGHADSTTTNPKHDMLSQILGPDQPGRLRAMGRGISMTKLNCLQVQNNYIAAMEQKQVSLQEQVNDLQKQLHRMNNQGPATDVSENSNNKSVNNTRSLPKCYLVDWASPDENVAEGRVVSCDADELVNGIPLGPHDVKVLVETALKPDTFLWRPAHIMFSIRRNDCMTF